MRSTRAVLLLWLSLVALLHGCGKQPAEETTPAAATSSAQPEAPEGDPPPTELLVTELASGSGPAIEPGATAVVHYTGWLYDPSAPEHKGAKFDSSRDRNEPFRFPLGGGQVIRGWDEGVKGMKVGEQVRLTIPPDMGYGESGAGPVIPPNATLVFDVELVGIE